MSRKELLESICELQEQLHVLAGGLGSFYVATAGVEFWRAHSAAANGPLLEALHWILLVADAVGSGLLLAIWLFRKFGLKKPSRCIEDEHLLEKAHEWLVAELGNPSPLSAHFCSIAEIAELARMNYEAFKDSAFEVEEERLEKRNATWMERNPRIFMMIGDPLHETQYVGYSAMLPLTREGLDLYLLGKIKDADLPALFIAPNKAATAGVIVFAIYLKPGYRFQQSEASRNYSIYFLACVRRHLAVLFPRPRKKAAATAYPPIYVQTEWSGMKRRLKRCGFVETGKKSAEGYDFLVYERPFANLVLQQGPTVMEPSLPVGSGN